MTGKTLCPRAVGFGSFGELAEQTDLTYIRSFAKSLRKHKTGIWLGQTAVYSIFKMGLWHIYGKLGQDLLR